jgi:hypothetical protein
VWLPLTMQEPNIEPLDRSSSGFGETEANELLLGGNGSGQQYMDPMFQGHKGCAEELVDCNALFGSNFLR